MATSDMESDFQFYLRFVKPLIFNLQEPRDRALAAAWVQKLMDKNLGSADLRTTYLKLLLFVLQRKKLRGIFLQNPNHIEGLEPFSEANLDQAARDLLAAENDFQDSPESGDFPPYCTEYSPDLLEYSAVQYIPNFGVHAYYAISNEPLPTWNRIEKAVFPRGTIRRSTTQIKVTTSKFNITESRQSLHQEDIIENDKIVRKTTSGSLVRRSMVLLQSKAKARMDKMKQFGNQQGSSCNKPTTPRRSDLTNVPLGVQVKEETIRDAPVWGTNLVPATPTPAWEPPTDMLEADSDSLCYEDARPCPNYQKPPRHGCGCPIKSKRPSSAAPPQKDDYYYSEYQTNYFQATSLSNLVSPVPSVPSRSPSPKKKISVGMNEHVDQNRRLYSYDIPGEGEINVYNPSAEFSIQMEESASTVNNEESSNFNLPYEGQMERQIPEKSFNTNQNQKYPVGFARKNRGYPQQQREGINHGETEIRVIHQMDKRHFPSVQSRSGFVIPPQGQINENQRFSNVYTSSVQSRCGAAAPPQKELSTNQVFPNVDASSQSDALIPPRPRVPTLPPIPERQQELYNFKVTQGQAEVNRIIEQTILNTKRIEEDLEGFDRFIAEYENKVDFSLNV